MLRKIRITLAILSIIGISLLFLDFTGTIHVWLGWLAKIQFLPALLALNIGVVITLVLLTLIFGRIYCSVICPLGIMQDGISWLGSKRKKNRFRYSPAMSWLRYGVLALFVVALVVGAGSLVALLAPYSSYGRIVSNLFAPLYQWGNNLLAYFAERADSYAFYSVDVWVKSFSTFAIAAITFIALIILSWKNGRTYCNTICPVGTILGFFARYAWLKPVIDTDKCVNCNLCERNCKAACINIKEHQIDYSRCVSCMNCIEKCPKDAIHYTYHSKKQTLPTDSRRRFLTIGAMFATASALKAQEKKVDGGLAVIEDKKIPNRPTPITPPGSHSIRNFTGLSTLCFSLSQPGTTSFNQPDDIDAA